MLQIDLTKKYALAVSGGVDSMTMLHMFASLFPRPDFYAVTVNHNIRSNAQADCDFVKGYCDSLNVECITVSVDVPKYAAEYKLSEETAARILRYKAFDGLQCDFVCLAHHLDDNAETVLMHILRGSGAQGATGIRRQNGKYLRPLLDMTRKQIERYAELNNVPFAHDYTNDDDKYTRNYIRQNVMPLLKRLNPNAEKNIVRFADNIAEDCDYLDSLADISQVEFGFVFARIPVSLLRLPKPLAYRIISKTFWSLGVRKDIEKTHVDAIIDLAQGVGGRQVCLPFGFVAVSDYDCVTIEQACQQENYDFEIPFKCGFTETPLGVVEVSKNAACGALMFDLDKMPSNAVFRLKRQGDNFTKFGGGSKSLKKYLIDKKIPQRLRQNLLLVAADNDVCIICGVEISDKIKVEDKSNSYYIKLITESTNEA